MIIFNYIWKNDDDCREIFDYIKNNFDNKYLSIIGRDDLPTFYNKGYKYHDSNIELNILMKESEFFFPNIMITIGSHSTEESIKLECSPLTRIKFWIFFDKNNRIENNELSLTLSKIRNKKQIFEPTNRVTGMSPDPVDLDNYVNELKS